MIRKGKGPLNSFILNGRILKTNLEGVRIRMEERIKDRLRHRLDSLRNEQKPLKKPCIRFKSLQESSHYERFVKMFEDNEVNLRVSF